ncbi:MAG: hypothetical protein SOT46_11165 [Treponema sp.]|nr:hypothetical protein [Treponema sp.]
MPAVIWGLAFLYHSLLFFLGSPEGCRLVENPKRQSLVGGKNGKSNIARS